eukprot:scaffold154333_cov36-Tisochrysis_lutea.AAC.1
MASALLGRRAAARATRLVERAGRMSQSTAATPSQFCIAGQNRPGKAIYLDSQVRFPEQHDERRVPNCPTLTIQSCAPPLPSCSRLQLQWIHACSMRCYPT